MPPDWYRERAAELFARPGTEFDKETARVEAGTGPASPGVFRDPAQTVIPQAGGAWVMFWAWVPDPKEATNGDG